MPDGERPVPAWTLMDRELRRPGVTRALLWEEYRAFHPLCFGYAWLSNRIASVKPFCKSDTSRAIQARQG